METGMFLSHSVGKPHGAKEEQEMKQNKAREGQGSFLKEVMLELNLEN